MARKLLYSERKRLAETGTLGPLADEPSEPLLLALGHLFREGEGRGLEVGPKFRRRVNKVGFQYLGWQPGETLSEALFAANVEQLLDLVEVVVEEGERRYAVRGYDRYAIPNAQNEVNDLFDRHRFGYRLENGEIRKIGSPALDDIVVGPTLLAVQRPGWEEVERSFKEAIQHQRGGSDENDDALTAANAAVEAALKAAGFKGANLGPLAKDFKKSSRIPSELRGVPEALDALIGRSGALRSSYGDSHGKASGANPVPQALVDLAIHWAAAFIVYVSDSGEG